jgi:hypothetical protein
MALDGLSANGREDRPFSRENLVHSMLIVLNTDTSEWLELRLEQD